MDEFKFLGWRVKRPWAPGAGWEPIELVCCMGESLCEPPEDWVQRWDFNRAACYGSPEAPWASVGEEDPRGFRLFAYWMLPIYFEKGDIPESVPLDEILAPSLGALPEVPPELDEMTELGYDIAEHFSLHWPYSPLVNSGFANSFPVNRYGLLHDLETAKTACAAINAEKGEHDNHWVIQVYGQDVDSVLHPKHRG